RRPQRPAENSSGRRLATIPRHHIPLWPTQGIVVSLSHRSPDRLGIIPCVLLSREVGVPEASGNDLRDKVALVVGGTQNMGLAIAEEVAGRGANVVVSFGHDEQGAAAAGKRRGAGG